LPSDFPFILDLSSRFDRLLQLGPREFEYPLTGFAPGVRFVGPVATSRSGGAATLLPVGRSRRRAPIVLVTQGTLDNGDFSSLVQPTLEGLADFDGHVVVSTGGVFADAVGPPATPASPSFCPTTCSCPG